jgi:hypothetical protein
LIDLYLDVHDEVTQSKGSRHVRGLKRPNEPSRERVRPDVQKLLASPIKRNTRGYKKSLTERLALPIGYLGIT